MTARRLLPLLLPFLAVGAPSLALAQDGPSAEPPWTDDEAPEPVVPPPPGEAIAPITVGSLINGTSGGVVVGPEEAIRERLLGVLADNGLPAQAPAGVRGGRLDAGDARFILNGTVTDQACQTESHWSGCRWRILWSIVDRERKEVVLEATGVGEASVPQIHPSTDMYVELIARAALPLARSPRLRTVLARVDPVSSATGWARDVGARPCAPADRTLPADTRELQPALFTVRTPRGRADGVLFSPDGLGVTAAGPLVDSRVLTATRADGTSLGLTVLRVDETADLALVALNDTGDACVPVRGRPADLGEALYALGTRGDAGWGLRTGTVTGTVRHGTGPHLDTDAALSELSARAPLFDESGAWLASAPPAGTEALLAIGALDRLGVVPSDTPDDLVGIERSPRRAGDPVRLDLGGAVDAPLQAPIGPGGRVPTIADTPGGLEMAGGGVMVGVGVLVGVPTGMVWMLEESSFDVNGSERATYAVVTGLSAGLAIGGAALIYRGLRKADQAEDPGTRIMLSPTGVGLSGRF